MGNSDHKFICLSVLSYSTILRSKTISDNLIKSLRVQDFKPVLAVFSAFRLRRCQGWEHLLAGAILSDQQEWHLKGQMSVRKPGLTTYQIHVVRGDATNSSAVQKSKVHTCSCRSTYCSQLSSDLPGEDDPDGNEDELGSLPFSDRVRDCFGDLQYLFHGSANELWGLYNKQLQSMGAPTFHARAGADGSDSAIRIFCQVSDDGPDQRGVMKLIKAELASDRTTFYCRFKCLMHQVHLIVCRQLKRLSSLLDL